VIDPLHPHPDADPVAEDALRELADADPTDLPGLRSRLAQADPDGRLHPIGLHAVVIGSDVLPTLPDAVTDVTNGRSVVVLVDRTPMARRGADLKAAVHDLLAPRFDVRRIELGHPGRELHADEDAVAQATRAVVGADAVVVVGSGTITDIAKAATMGEPRPPLLAVQTAASVNGFADGLSVLLRDGAKRTVPTRWPDVLIVDLEVLAAAPPAMNVAGLGDLLAVFTAPTDWYLAALVGMDTSYHPVPATLCREQTRRLIADAEGIGRSDPAALEALARLLTLSGISMGIAGTTAPSSGAEHVTSHLVDMAREQRGTQLALHGAQVGVATIPTAGAWAVLLDGIDLDGVGGQMFPEPEVMEPVVRSAFATIDPSGRVGSECWRDYERKLAAWHGNRGRLAQLMSEWPTHRDTLARLVASPAELASALAAAQAPTRFAELAPPVEADLARWAVTNARLMRNRFSIADLLAFTGLWGEGLVASLFTHAETVGGGF
jgi:glycerol-1-phosphate dehydrogenase [NAD(P)+]